MKQEENGSITLELTDGKRWILPCKPVLPDHIQKMIDLLRALDVIAKENMALSEQDNFAFVSKICDLQDFVFAHTARQLFDTKK